jgi:hypothetical protein
MPNVINWDTAFNSRGNVLSTELNSLADAAFTAVGTEITNNTNLDQYGLLQLNVTFGTNPSAGAYVNIYMVTAPDGTNYEDGSATVLPAQACLIASIDIRASTTAQKRRTGLLTLLPAKTKFILENKTGQAFPASGSTLVLFSTNDEIQ